MVVKDYKPILRLRDAYSHQFKVFTWGQVGDPHTPVHCKGLADNEDERSPSQCSPHGIVWTFLGFIVYLFSNYLRLKASL